MFAVLVIVIILVFLASVAGGAVVFSFLRNGYASEELAEPVKLKYSPSAGVPAELQKNLRSNLVKIVKYQDFSKTTSLLEKTWNANDIIAYGLLVSSDGWIITSYLPQLSFLAITSEGDLFSVQKVFRVKSLGLSFVKIYGASFSAAALGDERGIMAGDDLFVIEDKKVFNNALVYYGYSSAARKRDFILTSEFANKFLYLKDGLSGIYSGAAVFSKKGEAVGIVNDDGLVVPVSLVKSYLKRLWENESVSLPYLGIKYFDLSVLPVKTTEIPSRKGAYVIKDEDVGVIKNSPAYVAGIKPGDIIVSIMGDEINEEYNLAERLSEYKPNDKVDLEVVRGGEKIELSAELGEQK